MSCKHHEGSQAGIPPPPSPPSVCPAACSPQPLPSWGPTLLFALLRWSRPSEPQLRSSPAFQPHPSPVTATSSHHHLAPDLISPLPAEAGDLPPPPCHQIPPCHQVPPCHQDVPGAVASPRAGAGPQHHGAQRPSRAEQGSPPFPSTHRPRPCATRIFIELIY